LSEDETWRRLRWSARRGMRELDVLLERFLLERWASASAERRAEFSALLDLPDPELAALCLGREPPPPEWRALMAELTGQVSELSAADAVYPHQVGQISPVGGDA